MQRIDFETKLVNSGRLFDKCGPIRNITLHTDIMHPNPPVAHNEGALLARGVAIPYRDTQGLYSLN